MIRMIPLLLLLPFGLQGQQYIGFSIGGTLGNVRFKPAGNRDSDLVGIPGATATIFYMGNFTPAKSSSRRFKPQHYLTVEGGYKSLRLSDKLSSVTSNWSLRYLTGLLTLRRQHNKKKKVNPFYGGGLVVDMLLSGIQNRGLEQFNLKDELRNLAFGATIETGLRYHISNDAYSTVGLGYLRGLSNLEKDPDQKANLDSIRLSITLFLEL